MMLKKLNKTILFFFLFLFSFSFLNAQSDSSEKCGYDLVQELQKANNEKYAFELETFKNHRANSTSSTLNKSNPTVYTIPVVVHVIHQGQSIGSGSNLSVSQIESQIDILNEDFRRQNSDANQTPSVFTDEAADVEIEFCLAKIDPFGNETNGITRNQYNTISSLSYIEQNIKPVTSWNSNLYLNIWTIAIPGGSIIGYSFLPTTSMVGSDQDGLVISYERFGYISSTNRGRTTTHEVGHYLGLSHVWGENDSNGNPIGCSSDDGFSDTPNSDAPYYGCPTFGSSSCNSTDMHMNYMDYPDDYCLNLFTNDQGDFMQSILTGIRSDLSNNALSACEEIINPNECLLLNNNDLTMGFEGGENFNGWVAENTNNDNSTWFFTFQSNDDWGPNNGNGHALYLWNEDAVTSANDYFFTPCFEIKDGHTYELKFSYACAQNDGVTYPEKLDVGFSANQSSNDFYTLGNDWTFNPVNNIYPNYNDATLSFVATENSNTSIGFHVYSEADMYAMQVDDIQIRDLTANPVEDFSAIESFSIFPNPAKKKITINLYFQNTEETVNISLYDALGRQVFEKQYATVQNIEDQFDLSHLSKGIYFLSVQTATNRLSKKLVLSD